MKAESFITLFKYNAWANERVFQAAAALPKETIHQHTGEVGETLLRAMIHILDVAWSWRVGCETRTLPNRSLSEETLPDIPALIEFNRKEMGYMLSYLHTLKDEDFTGTILYRYDIHSEAHTGKLWHILIHIINHGTHHRAEICQRMVSLGAQPVQIDFNEYLKENPEPVF